MVRAVRGERQHYRPIVSPLCEGSDPVVVSRALLAAARSRRLYVADLDALTGGVPQVEVIAALAAALPAVEAFWVDAGFEDRSAGQSLLDRLASFAPRIVPVFASEALASAQAFERCFDPGRPVHPDALLSLDRRGQTRLDRAGVWERPEAWPARVIAMTLERVGSGEGPDLEALRALRERAPRCRFIGAGGLRDARDAAAARAAGAEAWLVASALHDGRLASVP